MPDSAPPFAPLLDWWTQTQQQTLDAWTRAAQGTQAPFSPTLAQEALEQWQQLVQKSLQGWSDQTPPVAQDVLARWADGQAGWMRLLQALAEAGQAFTERLQVGDDWEAALAASSRRFREELHEALEAVQTDPDPQALWAELMQPLRAFGGPWMDAFTTSGTNGEAGPSVALFADRFFDAYDHTFGRLVDSPALGLTRELQGHVTEAFQAAQTFQRANMAYQGEVADIWGQAFERILEHLGARAREGEAVGSARELMRLVTDVADEVFTERFRTDDYVQVQGELLHAGLVYRQRRRALLEQFLRQADLPTRTELDEVHELLYELRKGVKQLRRAHEAAPDLAGLEETVAKLRKDVPTLKGRVTTLSNTGRAERDAASERAAGLENAVEALQARLAEQSEQLAGLAATVEAQQAAIDEQQATIVAQQTTIDDLRAAPSPDA